MAWSPERFRDICPWLHVDDKAFQKQVGDRIARLGDLVKEKEELDKYQAAIVNDGFVVVNDGAPLEWCVDIEALARGVFALRKAGLPASFIAAYDEVWAAQIQASKFVGGVCGGNTPVMDTLCFFVEGSEGGSGFSVHRDRVVEDWESRNFPKEVAKTFRKDGSPRYCTMWIALTEAKPANSCLHFLPREHDKNFMEEGSNVCDVFGDLEAIQSITAAPLQHGGATVHSHRTIHWGSPVSKLYKGPPRISLSFSFSDPKFEPPYLTRSACYPEFCLRLALSAAQVINYSSLASADGSGWKAVGPPVSNVQGDVSESQCASKRVKVAKYPPPTLTELHALFKQHISHFDRFYVNEITAKFFHKSKGDIGMDSDAEDAALEAVLDAEAAGGALFHDDFDVGDSDRDSDES
eukprot:CAMPEP_0203756380 /NCGR_PEP_ID=MMETSP0098-20131031/9683_1 /ASSEMBLY_ACC=CAM_ASM_000208 /TAXON_ID=96639 /ORGANISM=" , Strain NY0313808BC1" /LENGTH=407 /DNA_ID=CAMNT_0050648247 /DNA_START=1537 /DNA_END=2760 /DNA_ORIENTATION=-